MHGREAENGIHKKGDGEGLAEDGSAQEGVDCRVVEGPAGEGGVGRVYVMVEEPELERVAVGGEEKRLVDDEGGGRGGGLGEGVADEGGGGGGRGGGRAGC